MIVLCFLALVPPHRYVLCKFAGDKPMVAFIPAARHRGRLYTTVTGAFSLHVVLAVELEIHMLPRKNTSYESRRGQRDYR